MIWGEAEIVVPFGDCDAMEVVWHGNYARYLEMARSAALNKIAYDYLEMRDSGYAWPVIEMKLRYPRPITFGQKIIARAELKEWENRMRFEYEIRDAKSGERLTKAETVQVALDMRKKEMCFQSPAVLFQKLGLPLP